MQDADSLDKAGTKKEGAFYMWTSQEIREVLGDAAPLFISHYYVKDKGNADLNLRSDPHGEFGGLNCLRQAQTLQETAKQAGIGEEEAQQTLAACREKLHTRRGQRPRPHLDDKVCTPQYLWYKQGNKCCVALLSHLQSTGFTSLLSPLFTL